MDTTDILYELTYYRYMTHYLLGKLITLGIISESETQMAANVFRSQAEDEVKKTKSLCLEDFNNLYKNERPEQEA